MTRYAKLIIGLTVVMTISEQSRADKAGEEKHQKTADIHESLPSYSYVIQKSFEALPESFSENDFRKWEKRIRRSALLPRIQLRIGTRESDIDRFTSKNTTEIRYDGPIEDDVIDFQEENSNIDRQLTDGIEYFDEIGVFFTWNLSELLWHNDELEAVEIKRRIADFKYKVANEVGKYYYRLNEALQKLQFHPDSPKSALWRQQAELNLALINAFTNDALVDYRTTVSLYNTGNKEIINSETEEDTELPSEEEEEGDKDADEVGTGILIDIDDDKE